MPRITKGPERRGRGHVSVGRIGGASVHWDVVPQLQVTLNTRQHVMGNIGVRIPVDDPTREPEVLIYLLWDYFDGGFFEGW